MISVTHNMLAMNANRQLGMVVGSRQKSTEKLSSGYKINRAADDAAGLQISEKMRSQIRGLTQASSNCQDGVSLVQIGDGALAEVHDMIHRCTELAVKSANGTNTDADRDAIQQEVNQILDEIDSIAKKTQFNTKPILLGDSGEVVKKIKRGSQLPKWVGQDSGNPGYMDKEITSVQTADGNSYKSGGVFDFSNVNSTNINELVGTGFHFTCCTCNNYYSINFTSRGADGQSDSSKPGTYI